MNEINGPLPHQLDWTDPTSTGAAHVTQGMTRFNRVGSLSHLHGSRATNRPTCPQNGNPQSFTSKISSHRYCSLYIVIAFGAFAGFAELINIFGKSSSKFVGKPSCHLESKI
jgi:hypothetical protein